MARLCRWWVPVGLAYQAAFGLTGCHKASADTGVTIACTVVPQPARAGSETVVTVRLADRTAKPVSGAHISIEGDMSHPGMAPVFAQARETDPGSYVAHLQLTMAGDWVILVQGTLANGRKIDRQVDVKGVLPG